MAQASTQFGAKIRVDADIKEVTQYLTAIQRKIVPKSASRALNSAQKKTQTQMVRSVSSFFSLKQKLIRYKLAFSPARPDKLITTIFGRWYPIPFIRTGKASETKKGVRVKGNTIAGAFIAVMKDGHHHIMKRKDAARLPIKEPKIQIYEDANRLSIKMLKTKSRVFFLNEFNRLLARGLKR